MKTLQTFATVSTVLPELPGESLINSMPYGYYLAFIIKKWTPVLICYGTGGANGKMMVSLEDPQQTWSGGAKFSFQSLVGESITLKITTEHPA